MEKHKIAYIDENQRDIRTFQRQVHEILEVLEFLPKSNLDDFVEELLTSGAEAIVADFRLNEYRLDEQVPINYDGTDLIKKVL